MSRRVWSVIMALVVAVAIPLRAAAIEGFCDVEAGAWYADAVAYVHESGFMCGMGQRQFAPEKEMTRAQAASVLYRVAGSPSVEYTSTYTDVSKDGWYLDAVSWAEAQKITAGVSEKRYAPEAAITREQFLTMLWRLDNLKNIGENDAVLSLDCPLPADCFNSAQAYDQYEAMRTERIGEAYLREFTDEKSIAPYAREALAWAVEAGLVTGDVENRLHPSQTISRAQAAQILYRVENPVDVAERHFNAFGTDISSVRDYMSDTEEAVVRLINQERAGYGIKAGEDGAQWALVPIEEADVPLQELEFSSLAQQVAGTRAREDIDLTYQYSLEEYSGLGDETRHSVAHARPGCRLGGVGGCGHVDAALCACTSAYQDWDTAWGTEGEAACAKAENIYLSWEPSWAENKTPEQIAQAVFSAWLNSETHRKVMMSPLYTKIGVQVYSNQGHTCAALEVYRGREDTSEAFGLTVDMGVAR